MAGVKGLFGQLGIPVYPLIGNHDHDRAVSDDDASAENYRRCFGPTYYAFDLGRTHYIVLDDIIYHGDKHYDEQLDTLQLAWAARYARLLPTGSRVCIAMHAPVYKSWLNHTMENIEPLLAAFAASNSTSSRATPTSTRTTRCATASRSTTWRSSAATSGTTR